MSMDTITQHIGQHTSVHTVPSINRGIAGYVGTCECGWEGTTYSFERHAAEDARWHARECLARGEVEA